MPQHWDTKNEAWNTYGGHLFIFYFFTQVRASVLMFPHRDVLHSVRFQMELPVEPLISDGNLAKLLPSIRASVLTSGLILKGIR